MRRMILYLVGCVVVIAVGLALFAWAGGLATTGMSTYGIVAMAAGVLFSFALAIGLMALIFYSNRSGRDEAASHHEGPDDPHP